MKSLPALLLLTALAAGCRTPRSSLTQTAASSQTPTAGHATENNAAPEEHDPSQASTLGSGDLVEVRVFQEQDLTGSYRISPEGAIDFPLCGKVKLLGMTSSVAADTLRQCLSNGFLKRPQVNILIREYNSKKVFVFGEVQKPGTFPFEENMNIIQAVTLAGGFTKLASKNNTNVTRLVAGAEKKTRVPVEDIGVGREKNFLLKPGDIVFVPESFF
ncbi:MAG: polysaccharide biosynthesis/export family protein [Myxococcaceae bacterium]